MTETERATQHENVSGAYRRAVTLRAGAYASGNARRIRAASAEVERYARMLGRLREVRPAGLR